MAIQPTILAPSFLAPQTINVQWGNQNSAGDLSFRLTGPVSFAGSVKTQTTPLDGASGHYATLLFAEASAQTGAAFTLTIDTQDSSAVQTGVVGRNLYLPLFWRTH